jgi:hypothetical protein
MCSRLLAQALKAGGIMVSIGSHNGVAVRRSIREACASPTQGPVSTAKTIGRMFFYVARDDENC